MWINLLYGQSQSQSLKGKHLAKVISPLNSAAASGSVGGVTYQRSRVGHNARAWVRPVKSRSIRRGQWNTQTFPDAQEIWSNLSSNVISEWEDWARTHPVSQGQSSRGLLSAYQWFLKLNLPAIEYLNQQVNTPPFGIPFNFFPNIDAIWTASGVEVSWDPAIPSGSHLIVFQRRTMNSVRQSIRNTRFSHLFSNGDLSPQLITPPCSNGGGPSDFGPFLCKTFVQVVIKVLDDSGRTSVPLFFNIASS